MRNLAGPRAAFVAAIVMAQITYAGMARAQYPERPIQFVVPFGPGGLIDSVARIFANGMSPLLGQQIITDNRSGGSGKIGSQAVAHTDPHGYTVLIDLVTRPTLLRATTPGTDDLNYEIAFTPVGLLGTSPLIMNVSPNLGVSTFAALVQKVRSEPGKHSYGSPGLGSTSHAASEQIRRIFALDAVHVPYRSGPAALGDLMGGQLTWTIDSPNTSAALIESKKVVPLFVINEARTRQLPNIPTLAEIGHPEMNDARTSIFMLVPVNTPSVILKKLHETLIVAQKDPEVVRQLESLALVAPKVIDLATTKSVMSREIRAWEKAVEGIHSRPEK